MNTKIFVVLTDDGQVLCAHTNLRDALKTLRQWEDEVNRHNPLTIRGDIQESFIHEVKS